MEAIEVTRGSEPNKTNNKKMAEEEENAMAHPPNNHHVEADQDIPKSQEEMPTGH